MIELSNFLIEERYLQKALELHQTNPVVDAHLDLAGEILLRYQTGEKEVIRNHYLKAFREVGINLIVSSVYVDNSMLPEMGLRNALDQISALHQDLETLSGEVMLVQTRQELQFVLANNKIGIILYMEGLDCIGRDIALISILHRLGVRGAALTWSRRNELAAGCCPAREKRDITGGISEWGWEAVRELERLSMFLDISHLNDEGFAQIARGADKPFIATHSNARAVYDNYRNLQDQQIRQLCGSGGLIGINGCSLIAGSHREGNHLEMLCRHIEHLVRVAGAEHVGYGFDLCDSYNLVEPRVQFPVESQDCFAGHGQIPYLTAALLQRGMPEEQVTAIIGNNFYRYFLRILPE